MSTGRTPIKTRTASSTRRSFSSSADSPEFNEELYRRIWKALKQGEERFMANKLEGGISKDAMKPYMSVVATKRMEQHRWRGEAPKFESSTPAPAQDS
mmetsp:Transcript_16636/g.53166  ORF Transcript_16636/g.53166 Transcript_16636/m.53166 type:complete len:98 (+) Transcript_16636:167-460(+)